MYLDHDPPCILLREGLQYYELKAKNHLFCTPKASPSSSDRSIRSTDQAHAQAISWDLLGMVTR